jgi:glycosyltransferase involved in cell wall biosynthesis
MTAYNQEKYIKDAIESVLSSTFQDYELIIVDDASTDATVKVIDGYLDLDKRIKFYKNEKNLGDYKNRNKAASYAIGKYLKYLDADDVIYPHGLEAMVSYMERFSDAALGISLYQIELELPYPIKMVPREILRSEYLSKSVLGLGPSAAIIKRESFIELNGFNDENYISDTDLWLKIATSYPIILFNPSLNWYRRHANQQIANENKDYKIKLLRLEQKRKYLIINKCHFTESEFRYAEKRIAQHFSRLLLRDLMHGFNFNSFFYLYRKSKINIFDLMRGFRNYYQ